MDFIHEENKIYLKNEEEKILAEVTFPNEDENTVVINHTFVDESLRGKGIANELLKEVVKDLRKKKLKCIPTCSYAIHWFEKNEEERDLIKK